MRKTLYTGLAVLTLAVFASAVAPLVTDMQRESVAKQSLLDAAAAQAGDQYAMHVSSECGAGSIELTGDLHADAFALRDVDTGMLSLPDGTSARLSSHGLIVTLGNPTRSEVTRTGVGSVSL